MSRGDEVSGMGRLSSRTCRVIAAGFCVLVLSLASRHTGVAQPASGPGPAPYEQQVKAVFVYEFTHYLRWPTDSSARPFVIAVLGETIIVEPLREIAAKRKVGERDIVVRPVSTAAEAGDCQVLFIASSAAQSTSQVRKELGGRALLTIGETEGAARRGLAVNFYLDEGRVRFEINLGALRRAGIEPSSKLLTLARLIDEEEG